jgi:hypothetical protein
MAAANESRRDGAMWPYTGWTRARTSRSWKYETGLGFRFRGLVHQGRGNMTRACGSRLHSDVTKGFAAGFIFEAMQRVEYPAAARREGAAYGGDRWAWGGRVTRRRGGHGHGTAKTADRRRQGLPVNMQTAGVLGDGGACLCGHGS